MAEWFDYDPVTGVTEYFDQNPVTGEVSIRYEQDVSGFLDYTKHLRNTGATDGGIKEEWWLWASVPTVVQMEMMKKGIEPRDFKAVAREINTNYPFLKTTTKHHA